MLRKSTGGGSTEHAALNTDRPTLDPCINSRTIDSAKRRAYYGVHRRAANGGQSWRRLAWRWGMWYVIVGAVLALAGIGVAVYAWRGWLGEARRSGTAATEHALALRDNDAALAAARRRADALEHQFREVIEQLVSDGAIVPVHDALTVTADNIPYSRETTPAPVSLPHVEGIAPATLRSTLELIAERAVSTDRPLARPGLVVAGGLSRNQYDALRRTLVEAGYFTPPTGKQSPTLTPRGVALLAAIREGRLVI